MTAQVTGPNPVYISPADQAEALAEALAKLGFTVRVQKNRSFQRHPRITVHCGPTRHIQNIEQIFAAPDNDGEWWFHRALPEDVLRTEKIAPLSQVSAAADLIARTLPKFRD
jgi:hypothetical protein